MPIIKNPLKKTRLFHTDYDAPIPVPSKIEGIFDSPGSSLVTSPTIREIGTRISFIDRLKNFYYKASIEENSVDQGRSICESTRKRELNGQNVKTEARTSGAATDMEKKVPILEEPDELNSLYKPLSMNMSKYWLHEERILFRNIDFEKSEGKILNFRARIHALRRMSAKMVFVVFRQQTITIQGILQSFTQPESFQKRQYHAGMISEAMVRSIEHYPSETIVVVRAKLRKVLQRVKNVTIHDYEFEIHEVHKVVELIHNAPFTVYDAENITKKANRGEGEKYLEDEERGDLSSDDQTVATTKYESKDNESPQSSTFSQTFRKSELSGYTLRTESMGKSVDRALPLRVRLNNRVLDLRTGHSQAIFRVQSGISNLFRSYLDTQGFIEIHTPKLQGGATESGATVFELDYFGRPAFLAQSPQLSKQMCIAADFERVYEIGPVFRAEESNTSRHLTEFTGLDLEMTIEEHYHEALDLIDEMFKKLWQGIYNRHQSEIDLISEVYHHDRVQWLEKTPRISFSEAIQFLREDGCKDDEGDMPSEYENFSSRAEIRLGELIKKKYHADYYIIDKFPASARPFYTMPDPSDERFTNSFDIFLRGQEILSGGQRIHDTKFLEKQMKKLGVRPESMSEYFEGFCLGASPHAGCGIGLERLSYLFLNLGNIRLASLFPRDPKSFPNKPSTTKLHHEEASTINLPWEGHGLYHIEDLQPLEKLIANYGDAANTSWLDSRYHVWRHSYSGAAQGYAIHNGYAIVVGEPLCAVSQYHQIIPAFLQFLQKKQKLKPIWMIVGSSTEEILADKYLWTTIGCIAEERLIIRNNPVLKDKVLARKIRHAHNEGVKEIEITPGQPILDSLRAQIDEQISKWQRERKGAQIHLTQIKPWVDEDHRRYFYSQTGDGSIQAFVVLHQLSPQNGYQVKFSLEFPGAPSGTIESLILHSLSSISLHDPEVKQVTFGTGATSTLVCGRNLGRRKTKTLKKMYESIYRQLKLNNKSEFRQKLGVRSDPVYICYPRGGLGPSGIRAIMGFLDED